MRPTWYQMGSGCEVGLRRLLRRAAAYISATNKWEQGVEWDAPTAEANIRNGKRVPGGRTMGANLNSSRARECKFSAAAPVGQHPPARRGRPTDFSRRWSPGYQLLPTGTVVVAPSFSTGAKRWVHAPACPK